MNHAGDLVGAEVDISEVDEDFHRPVSPARPAEGYFMNNLSTENISATALAQHIHRGVAAASVVTDDFATATSYDSLLCLSADEDLFGKDALLYSRDPVPKETPMTSTNDETMHIDAAEKVYDTAKGVWAWGKGIVIFSPFMGIAEGMVGKFAEIAGTTLEELDGHVIEKLHGLDDAVLNPAVSAVVGTILGAAGQTESFVKPIITSILKPVGLIKDDNTPEVTKPSVPVS